MQHFNKNDNKNVSIILKKEAILVLNCIHCISTPWNTIGIWPKYEKTQQVWFFYHSLQNFALQILLTIFHLRTSILVHIHKNIAEIECANSCCVHKRCHSLYFIQSRVLSSLKLASSTRIFHHGPCLLVKRRALQKTWQYSILYYYGSLWRTQP